jgi:hypothetical protein
MTRDEIARRAAHAQRLIADEAFQGFVAEIRGDCVAAFVNSGPQDSGTREEAHALLRAITKLEQKLSAAAGDEKIAASRDQKKERHRV